MQKEEYQVLYDVESKYWWFLGRKKVAFEMLDRHLQKEKFFEKSLEKGLKKSLDKENFLILDAGCGTGKNLEYLQKYGQTYGLDFCNDALNFCQLRGLNNLSKGEIEHLPYEDNTFDLVTCFGVLYHQGIKDDYAAIKELQRVCKPGGYVLITTPAGKFLTNKYLLSQHDISQHTARRHSKTELQGLLKKSGLDVVEITYFNTFLMPAVVLMRVLQKFTRLFFGQKNNLKSDLQLPLPFINRSLLSVLNLEGKLIKSFSLPFGLTLVTLARKGNN